MRKRETKFVACCDKDDEVDFSKSSESTQSIEDTTPNGVTLTLIRIKVVDTHATPLMTATATTTINAIASASVCISGGILGVRGSLSCDVDAKICHHQPCNQSPRWIGRCSSNERGNQL